jgi:putative MATE family efflux protein
MSDIPSSSTHSPAVRPLWQRFAIFLGPLVLTNVLQALSGTFNNIYLGQMLGAGAMASAVSFFPLLMLFVAFVIGLGAGSSVLIGQAWGGKNIDKVREIAGAVLFGGAVVGAGVAVVGFAAIPSIMRLLGTPPDILPAAVSYARVMMLALPLLFVFMLTSAVMRGMGDSVTPLRALAVSCATSAVLTPALIKGWLGIPPLGVPSAAWASLVSTLVALVWLAWYLSSRRSVVAPRELRRHLRLNRPLLRAIVRLGIPTGLFFVTGSLADIALLSLVNSHGSTAIAAWGAVNQVMAYVQFPAISMAITASVFSAQAIGANQPDQVDHVTHVGLAMNMVLTGMLAVLIALFAPLAVAMFIKEAAVIQLAASLLRITVWSSVIFGLSSVFSGVMRASGTVRVPTLISLGCLVFLLFPLGWGFGRMFGLKGIWLTYPVTYGCALLMQGSYFYGVWKKKPIEKLV